MTSLTLVTNDDPFDHCPGLSCPAAGVMMFAPNPDNGQDTLLTDALVTAGFGNRTRCQFRLKLQPRENIDQLTHRNWTAHSSVADMLHSCWALVR